MPTVDHSRTDSIKEVDCLIKGHLVDHLIELEDQRPVAAISGLDVRQFADQAAVSVDFVEQRLRTICEQIGSKDGVRTYRMKAEEQPHHEPS